MQQRKAEKHGLLRAFPLFRVKREKENVFLSALIAVAIKPKFGPSAFYSAGRRGCRSLTKKGAYCLAKCMADCSGRIP